MIIYSYNSYSLSSSTIFYTSWSLLLLLITSTAFYKAKQIEFKENSNDMVTETDKKSEEMIIGALKGQFPDHLFLGEEVTILSLPSSSLLPLHLPLCNSLFSLYSSLLCSPLFSRPSSLANLSSGNCSRRNERSID